MFPWSMQTLASDVLIIGGGAAALVAALEATSYTPRVTMVCKRRVGASGNTLVSGAGFAAFIPFPGTPDSSEQHYKDTMQGGRAINDKELVETMVEEAARALLDLEKYGVKFFRLNGELVRRHGPGHSEARSITTVYGVKDYLIRGSSILQPMLAQVLKRGVKLLEKTPIVRLVTKNGSIMGAIGLDLTRQELIWLPAKAVILAAGGGGRLFSQTNNTAEMTGDAFALALEAGVVLKDMEFIQFYPTMMSSPVKMAVSTPLFGDGALLRNREGERFMLKYAPGEGDMATRDKMVQAIFSEIKAGRGIGNQVYLDCTAIPKQIMHTRYSTLKQFLSRHRLDIQKEWLLVGPTTHFFMGGIKINRHCQTSVNGLFAAGECTGGIHGANRLSGNALTEAIVFGRIAGKSAATFALTVNKTDENIPKFDLPEFHSGKEELLEIRNHLCQSMWEHASILRSRKSLLRAIQDIRQCKDNLPYINLATFRDIASYLELSGMCNLSEVIVRASLCREESRGSHFREDMPKEDSKWLGSIEIIRHEGQLKLAFKAVNQEI